MASNDKRYCIEIAKKKKIDGNTKAALLMESAWAPGSTIKVAFMDGDPGLQKKVRDCAKRWTASGLANLTLDFITDPKNAQVRIAFMQGDGSWSYIGTDCLGIAHPDPTMNYGWLTPSSSQTEIDEVVLHEFGHALGLIHEHQNPLGGIAWNKPAVIADLSGPPNNWDPETIEHNIFKKYEPDAVDATKVDPASIMMYPIPAAWTLDGFSAGFNTDLSADDKAQIKKVYP
jgi:serralysin